MKKLQHIFDVSSGGQNNKYALLALTENGELYKYSNNTFNCATALDVAISYFSLCYLFDLIFQQKISHIFRIH